MWKLKKRGEKDRQVNKFKNYNQTTVLCLSCVPFWNTAECEEVSHFNQLLRWKRVCSRMDCLQVSNEEVPKSFNFQFVIHLCTKIQKQFRDDWCRPQTKSEGHFFLCLNSSLLGEKPFSWIGLGGEGGDTVSRFSSLLFLSRVCFTVESIIHQVRLEPGNIYTVYKLQSWTTRDHP